MKKIFKFWGYSRKSFEELVESGSLFRLSSAPVGDACFGKITFSEKGSALLPDFSREIQRGYWSYVVGLRRPVIRGVVIAELKTADEVEPIPLVSKDSAGCFHFNFDVDESLRYVEQERYLCHQRPLYLKFGVTPENLPIWLRKLVLFGLSLLRRVTGFILNKPRFPAPFKDISVDVWRYFVKAIIDRYCGQTYHSIPLWPGNKTYAVVLTHDVDSVWSIRNIKGVPALRQAEESRGLRSAWLIVTKLYPEGEQLYDALNEAGHEVGFHGVYHDHKLAYINEPKMRARRMKAGKFLRKYKVEGFRSPNFHRTKALYQVLKSVIRYDMTFHDTFESFGSPFSAGEGCSTCFPFYLDDCGILEIPTTICEDLTLALKGYQPKDILKKQKEIINDVAKRKGIANILTHPEPHLSSKPKYFKVYEDLLEALSRDQNAWVALPREVYAWWTARDKIIEESWGKNDDVNVSEQLMSINLS